MWLIQLIWYINFWENYSVLKQEVKECLLFLNNCHSLNLCEADSAESCTHNKENKLIYTNKIQRIEFLHHLNTSPHCD